MMMQVSVEDINSVKKTLHIEIPAEEVTREAVQVYGGMGYAEETDVSRYFADARVLSIFEGAEETLAIRVVGKSMVENASNS